MRMGAPAVQGFHRNGTKKERTETVSVPAVDPIESNRAPRRQTRTQTERRWDANSSDPIHAS